MPRTNCTVTVLEIHAEKTKPLIDIPIEHEFDCGGYECGTNLYSFKFLEIPNGEPEFLAMLSKNKIPYDLDYDATTEFTAGSKHYRINKDGQDIYRDFPNSDLKGMVRLNEVKKAYQQARLLEFFKEAKEECDVMLFDEQEIIIVNLEKSNA